MGLIKALVLALIAGVIGAAVWAAVSYFTGRELGLIAWGIGGLVGAAAGFGAAHEAGTPSGLIAVVVSLLAIAGGKAGVIGAELARYINENPPPAVTDENLISYYADDVAAEWAEAGEELAWPDSAAAESRWVEGDYPADVWAEAETRWAALSADEQAEHRSWVEGEVSYSSEEVAQVFTDTFKASFSLFDVLWVCLAVFTAFRLGASPMVDAAVGGTVDGMRGPGDES